MADSKRVTFSRELERARYSPAVRENKEREVYAALGKCLQNKLDTLKRVIGIPVKWHICNTGILPRTAARAILVKIPAFEMCQFTRIPITRSNVSFMLERIFRWKFHTRSSCAREASASRNHGDPIQGHAPWNPPDTSQRNMAPRGFRGGPQYTERFEYLARPLEETSSRYKWCHFFVPKVIQASLPSPVI